MSHPHEQTADIEQSSLSSAQQGHPPASDYADKSFYEQFHRHTISGSTNASGSNDSSPTTTVSTVDDSSATEPSPGSSPESPPPATFAAGMLRPRTSDDNSGAFFELQRQPPPRKGRNLKNLAVNTSRQTGRAASTTSLPLNPGPLNAAPVKPAPIEELKSSVASPAFVKPPSPPRRKPGNLGLTLLTPAASKQPPQEIRLAIPPTPAFGRPGTLRHFQSSPSLPLMPGLDSQTGVRSQNSRPFALETILSPIEKPKQTPLEEEEEQNFDIPLSREEKPEAYPDGPICVYDPHVDLYLEPTAEQCRQYDVIMNVASEVRNPLVEQVPSAPEEPEIRIDGGGGIQYAPRRPLTTEQKEGEARNADPSPTTPKATPLNSAFPVGALSDAGRKDPEYIHIPWEHNSDIVPDLLRLCKVIDDKVQQRKRVLVHCQCGVSRSASLVVAYGLYKDPTMSVQEAYDAIKRRSKWIGPNMNLIMQLQEFRTSLMRGGLLSGNRGFTPITPSSAPSEWRGPFSTNPSDPGAPMSAGPSSTGQTASTADLPKITPGPSSAPSGLKWPISDAVPPTPAARARAVSAVKRASAYVDPSGHIVPVLKIVEPAGSETESNEAHLQPPPLAREESSDSATPTEPASPRSEEFAMTALQPPQDVDPADMFGLMSPTSSSEFPHSSLDRPALLASLGMGSVRQDDAPRRTVSQRSPSRSQTGAASLAPGPQRKLRGKLSSPSLREQQQLQNLQARIEASLPHLHSGSPTRSTFGGVDDALMSPRATEFTKNPFALALSVPEQQHASSEHLGPNSADSDPRSPTQVGVSPITRNILDVL